MHLLSKDQLDESYTSTWSMNVKLIIHLANNHDQAYAIYHLISYAFMILICAYACNRFLEGVTLLEFKPEHQEEQQAAQE